MVRHVVLLILFLILWGTAQAQTMAIARYVPDSLHQVQLQEVIVTASEDRSLSTSSTLNRTAIEHIQPFTLSHLMQLLPGGLTPGVNLCSPDYFYIRSSYSGDHANTFGTGIWIDGARISSNTNLQMGLFDGSFSEYGYRGTDTRNIPLENIESVEVVRGIPSARYGDMTSGAVLIRSRTTAEPLTFNLKATPLIKAAQASRGWTTGENGIFNLFTSYTQTYTDQRSRERSFRKAGMETAWLKDFGQATFNARLSGLFSQDAAGKEKDKAEGEYTRARHTALTISLSGTWQAYRKLLTTLEYAAVANYSRQNDEQCKKHTQMESIGTNRMTAGEDTAFFIPPNYYSLARIEGIPVTAAVSLAANLNHKKKQWQSQTTAGLEWNSEGNRGRGRMDDATRPSELWTRSRSYRDIPFMHTLSFFVEENFILWGKAGQLAVLPGLRLSKAFASGQDIPLSVEPRLNIHYTPTPGFTLKSGWGCFRKMPSLAYLFPSPVYADHISFRYSDPDNSLAVLTTDVAEQAAQLSRLPRNNKAEIGFIARIPGLSIDLTAFHEHLRNGFSLEDRIRPSAYRVYRNDNLPGMSPVYTPEGVTAGGTPVGYSSDTSFIQYSSTGNQLSQKKRGIEFVITTGKWKAVGSTLVIDGMWLRTEETSGGMSIRYFGTQSNGKSFPYAAFFENAHTRIYERLSTNFRLVTHLPSIRFISSLTLQSVWFDRSRTRYSSRSGNTVYMKDAQGNPAGGDIYTDSEHNKYTNPICYMDTRGNIRPFTPEMATDTRYSSLVKSEQPYAYLTDSFRPYFLINLRITKEIGSHVRLTFYANNLAAVNPARYKATAAGYTTLNPPAFYGAELQLQF